MESLPATRRVGVAAPLSVFRPGMCPRFTRVANVVMVMKSLVSCSVTRRWVGMTAFGALVLVANLCRQ